MSSAFTSWLTGAFDFSFFPLIFQCDGCLFLSLVRGGLWLGCSVVPAMGALFSLGAGCQKWKPLDIPGTQPPLSDAVVNLGCEVLRYVLPLTLHAFISLPSCNSLGCEVLGVHFWPLRGLWLLVLSPSVLQALLRHGLCRGLKTELTWLPPSTLWYSTCYIPPHLAAPNPGSIASSNSAKRCASITCLGVCHT